MRSEACCGCTDVRHLDIVNPATEKTRSEGAEVAITHSMRRARVLRVCSMFAFICHHRRGSDKVWERHRAKFSAVLVNLKFEIIQ